MGTFPQQKMLTFKKSGKKEVSHEGMWIPLWLHLVSWVLCVRRGRCVPLVNELLRDPGFQQTLSSHFPSCMVLSGGVLRNYIANVSERCLVHPRKMLPEILVCSLGTACASVFLTRKTGNFAVHLSHPPTCSLEDGRVKSLRLRGLEWGKVPINGVLLCR